MNDLLLVNPCFEPGYNTSNVPLSLAILGGYLEDMGIGYDIIDPVVMGLDRNDVIKRARNCDYVGLTSFTHTREDCLGLAKEIKSANPECKIILGGPHASCLDVQILKYSPYVDIVVRGEGERALSMICEGEPLENVPGITYRHGDNTKRTSEAKPIDELDELPFPAYHKFPIADYIPILEGQKEIEELTHVGITTSRGCPFKCVFCASASRFKHLWRAISPERVGELIQYLYDKFSVRYFRFFDDNFTVNKKRVIQVCDEICERGLDITFRIEARVDSLTEEMLMALKKAGCHLMEIGIESGSDRILKNLNKKITVSQVKDAISLAKKHQITTKGFLMVSLPDERTGDVLETMKVARLPDFVTVGILTLLPGAPLTEGLKSKGRPNLYERIWGEFLTQSGQVLLLPVESLPRDNKQGCQEQGVGQVEIESENKRIVCVQALRLSISIVSAINPKAQYLLPNQKRARRSCSLCLLTSPFSQPGCVSRPSPTREAERPC
ncbi:MAG: B12-binding domain-containing radical SAM protein [Thermoplasmata archaeon]